MEQIHIRLPVSTDSKNNGVIGNANDGKVTVYSEGGKGRDYYPDLRMD